MLNKIDLDSKKVVFIYEKDDRRDGGNPPELCKSSRKSKIKR